MSGSEGQITFRQARIEDAEPIVEVIRSGIEPEMLGMTIYGCAGIAGFVREHIRAGPCRTDTAYTVACDETQVVGCAETRRTTAGIFLNYICTSPAMRSMGIGSGILRAAVAEAGERCAEVGLDVFAHNCRARAWYESLGFEVVGSNVWRSFELDALPNGGWGYVTEFPQARVCLGRFGFAQVRLVSGSGSYQIGLIGRRWFRVTDPAALVDGGVRSTLENVDGARRVLAVIPGTPSDGQEWLASEPVAVGLRMRAGRDSLIHALR